MSEDRRSSDWQAWFLAGFIVLVLIAILWFCGQPLYALLQDRARIQSWVEGTGAWGPLTISGLEMAQAIAAPIPGQAIEAVAGYLFGLWRGGLFAMAGIVTGSLLNFLLARRFGRPLATRLIGHRSLNRLDSLAARGGGLFFFLLWLLPFMPDDLACLAAGLTLMPTRRFLALMILGRFPGILVSTWIGANATQITPAWWVILTFSLGLGAVALWRWGKGMQQAILDFVQRLADKFRS